MAPFFAIGGFLILSQAVAHLPLVLRRETAADRRGPSTRTADHRTTEHARADTPYQRRTTKHVPRPARITYDVMYTSTQIRQNVLHCSHLYIERKVLNPMNLVLLGAPGAGKGTQAQKLVAEYGFAHISTGDLLRSAVKAQSPLGKEAKSYMDEGKLVPDSLVINLVKERLAQNDTASGFLLDGFPRNCDQAQALDEELARMGLTLDGALYVNVDFDLITKRLSSRRTCRACAYTAGEDALVCPACGGEMYQRDDDKPETIQKRLRTYEQETAPLVAYYQAQNKLIEVDGSASPDAVFAQTKELLGL